MKNYVKKISPKILRYTDKNYLNSIFCLQILEIILLKNKVSIRIPYLGSVKLGNNLEVNRKNSIKKVERMTTLSLS